MNSVQVLTEKTAESCLKDLGQSYRYHSTCGATIVCTIERNDAPTLIRLLKDSGFLARYNK